MNHNLASIGDHNWRDAIAPVINGEQKKTGLIPRDWSRNPQGCFAFAQPFPDSLLIPESEWQSRLDEQKAAKSSLWDLRQSLGMHSLDQDGIGYCWAFSSTKALMYLRAIAGDPFITLSGWMVGYTVKNGQDEGGWGGESLKFISENGTCALDKWPKFGRCPDINAAKSDAVNHKFVEWWDGAEDRATIKKQLVTAHLLGLPCVADFNWWGHSVCSISIESLNPFKTRIDNSWTDNQGEQGTNVLEGEKAIPDGLWIPRVATLSGV